MKLATAVLLLSGLLSMKISMVLTCMDASLSSSGAVVVEITVVINCACVCFSSLGSGLVVTQGSWGSERGGSGPRGKVSVG